MIGGLVPVQAVLPVAEDVPLDGAVEAFLERGVRNLNTRRAYQKHLRDAFSPHGVTHVGQLSGELLSQYSTRIMDKPGGMASKRQAIAAMRSFLHFTAAMRGFALSAPMMRLALKVPKAQTRLIYNVLSFTEAQTLLGIAEGPRERALVLVLLGGGLRLSEVARLDLVDVSQDVDDRPMLLVHGKGAKERLVPIHEEVMEALRTYIRSTERRFGDPGPVFQNRPLAAGPRRSPGRLTSRGIYWILGELIGRAGFLNRLSPHSFRDTFALAYLRRSKNLEGLRRILGHESLETTQLYIRHLELLEFRDGLPVWLPVTS